MNDAQSIPAPGLIRRIGRLAQWIVFAFLLLFAVIVATELRKVGVPGAPVPLLVITVAAAMALAMAHLPLVFTRLPRKGRIAAYASIIAMLILFGAYLGQMEPVWEKTPEGAKEAAQRAEEQREADAEAARQAARLKAEEEVNAQKAAAQQEADLASKAVAACDALIPQVVDGEKVIEINNVRPEPSTEPNEVLTCSGDAITVQGNVPIEFGLVQTPQGKSLVAIRFP